MGRLFISALLILCTASLGQSRSLGLHRRLRFLRRFLDGLSVLEGEIRAYAAPLPAAFTQAGTACPVFSDAAEKLSFLDAEAAFLEAVHPLSLPREETEILESFALGLLSADAEGQLSNIAACKNRIGLLLDSLSEDTARLGKLYTGGGVLLGLLLVVLCI